MRTIGPKKHWIPGSLSCRPPRIATEKPNAVKYAITVAYRWRLTAQRFDNGFRGNLTVPVTAEIPVKATKGGITAGIRMMIEDAYDWAEEALDSGKFKLPNPLRDYRQLDDGCPS